MGARPNAHRDAAQRHMDALQSTSGRVERLRKIKANPLLTVLAQTPEMRSDYYKT